MAVQIKKINNKSVFAVPVYWIKTNPLLTSEDIGRYESSIAPCNGGENIIEKNKLPAFGIIRNKNT